MSFWSSVGSKILDAAKEKGKEVYQSAETATYLRDSWENKSDSFLKDKLKNGMREEKMAAASVLKSRQ